MVVDPVGDMLAQMKNALSANKPVVSVPYSQLKESIAECLLAAGYLEAVESSGSKAKKTLDISLAYPDGRPAITNTERVSKPSRRMYLKADEIPSVKYGHGHIILTTPQGIMTGKDAEEAHVGGEALFKIW